MARALVVGCGRCSHCWSWPRFLLSRPRHLGVGVSGPADGDDAHRFITVMTRNLDEGTDFTPLFTATSVPTFVKAATAIFHEVVAGDISARARLVAREIAAAEPEEVSVREASLWQWQSPAGSRTIGTSVARASSLAVGHSRGVNFAR